MLTVRYPSGLAITYNDAVKLRYESDYHAWILYSDNSCTQWVASIQESASVIVECVRPCSITTQAKVEGLEAVAKEMRAIQRKLRRSELAGKGAK